MKGEIPVVTLRGGPGDRGLAHGAELKERIHRTWDFYRNVIFKNSPLSLIQIRDRADKVADLVEAFAPEYVTEIEAIAKGAGLEAWQVFALNARTEILNASQAECTALYFQQKSLLGQTWDWIQELEELMVITRYEYPDGRIIVTLTEPGILAKIGMNSSGLGVCLNILFSSHELVGVPVHILLRAILECSDIREARDAISRSGMGKSSHFLVADAQSHCFGMEFAADHVAEIAPQDGVLVHTNHCIGRGIESAMLPTSSERLGQARAWFQAVRNRDLEDLQQILLDDSLGPVSIQSCYRPEALMGGLEIGTCATIMMDLPNKTFYAQKGPGSVPDFQAIEL